MKKRLVPSVAAGFAAALYFCIVLPAQTYLGCVDSPHYSLSDLLGEFWVYFCLSWVGFSAALWALSYVPLAKTTIDATGRKHRKISLQFHVFALAVVVAAIVESGPLAIGLPELNGNFEGYRSGLRSCLDIAVLSALVMLPLVCYKWLKRHVLWIAMSVAFYSSVSLLDVKRQETLADDADGMIVKDLIPRIEVADRVVYAPTNNVMVLILDSVSTHAVQKMLRDDAALAGHFPGFVNYVNNLGMHCPTCVGVPGIFTGMHFKDAKSLATYGLGPYTKDSFIKPYIDKGETVFINESTRPTGYTNYQPKPQSSAGIAGQGLRPSGTIILPLLEMNICELSLFRITPYALKEAVVSGLLSAKQDRSDTDSTKDEGVGLSGNVLSDAFLWQLLASKPVDSTLTGVLNVHHSFGAHDPIMIPDDKGKLKGVAKPTYDDYIVHCKRAFKYLVSCMDVWRTNGVYDASTIILTSDHGTKNAWPENDLKGVPAGAFPILMVKPQGSKGEYCESDLATSHAKISPLVKALAIGALNREEIEKILYCPDRFYRANADGTQIVDWALSPDWNVKVTKQAFTEPKPDEIRPLEPGKKYTLDMNREDLPYADFINVNGRRAAPNGLSMPSGRPAVFSFLTPCKEGCLDVTFDVVIKCGASQKAKLEAFAQGAAGVVENTKPKAWVSLKLQGVSADKNGLVTIEFVKPTADAYIVLSGVSYSMAEPLGEEALALLKSWRVDFTCSTPKSGSSNLVCKTRAKDVVAYVPEWLLSKGLDGCVATGKGFDFDFTLVNNKEDDIRIMLRAPCYKQANGEALPLHADYASLKINGKELLDAPVSTTYYRQRKLVVHAKEGEPILVEGRLAPHKYSILELPQLLIDGSQWTSVNVYNVDNVMKNPQIGDFLK